VEFVRFDDSTTAVEWADEAVWSAWERAGQARRSPLATLLASAVWLPIGKGAVMDLGQVRVHAREANHSTLTVPKS